MKPKKPNLSSALGQRIFKLRKQLGWTQKTLGIECGWGESSQGRIDHYERGRRIPDHETVAALARALGTTHTALVYGNAGIHVASVPLVQWKSFGTLRHSHKKPAVISWPSLRRISAHARVTIVPDDSMSPEFVVNQLVLVDKKLHPVDGDFVICLIDGEHCIRLFKNNTLIKTFPKEKSVKYFSTTTPIIGVVISAVKNYR